MSGLRNVVKRAFNLVGLEIRRYHPTTFDPRTIRHSAVSEGGIEVVEFGWATVHRSFDYIRRQVYSRWDLDAANYNTAEELVAAHAWSLKGFGYARVLETVREVRAEKAQKLRILDIGGGGSGLSRVIAEESEDSCWVVDDFGIESRDRRSAAWYAPGLRDSLAARNPMVHYVYARLGGDTIAELPDRSFDVVYSVSTLEHIPVGGLPAVFDHMWRLLGDDGCMVHTIDLEKRLFPEWQGLLATEFGKCGVPPATFDIGNLDDQPEEDLPLLESPEVEFRLAGQQTYCRLGTLVLEARKTGPTYGAAAAKARGVTKG